MTSCQLCKRIEADVTEFRGIKLCVDCYFRIFGKYAEESQSFDREYRANGIVIWIKDEKVSECWMDNGVTKLPEDFKGLPTDSIPNLILRLNHIQDANMRLCSTCGLELSRTNQRLRHFAGIYCKKCAEEYKKKNETICLLCKKEHWRCNC